MGGAQQVEHNEDGHLQIGGGAGQVQGQGGEVIEGGRKKEGGKGGPRREGEASSSTNRKG